MADEKVEGAVNPTDSPSKLAHRPLVDGKIATPPDAKSNDSSKKDNKHTTPGATMSSLPDFIVKRNQLFDELKKRHDEEIGSKPHPSIKVVIELGKGEELSLEGKAFETTAGSFLRHVPKEITSDVVISKIDGKELWDLDRPLERDCRIRYVPFSSAEGREVFWHSSAHVLGEACECEFGCRLSHGPPTQQGFFYDMALEDGRGIKETDWKPLESKASKIFKERQPFERLEVSKENLRKMFGYSKYKLHYIDHLVEGEYSTVYRCGTLVDLCRGPHIQNTNKIRAFQIMKNSSAYFLGDPTNDSLQRIYGVAFPDKKQMSEYKKFLEEASKRDHRRIGVEQELFMFDEVAPGCPFLLPNGTRIFNALQKLLREEYFKRGYSEVQTPNMYDVSLWKTSGHWQHYQDDMFKVEVEKRVWGLKPMNCPGHCKIFANRERSYRELPLRMADFGVLHRNEASGALNGLTRVRKFQQDDTHIFCTTDQITQEIQDLFDFLRKIYGLFGFPFKLMLSTRPESYMGELETWNLAEQKLRDALDAFTAQGGSEWELNPGDGAFYGPKIDITIQDALKREHQCATIQLDFQLPHNFKLEYVTGDKISEGKGDKEAPAQPEATGENALDRLGAGRARPVMIHRAIIGSFERFLGILIEHFAGKWPFWLSPRQVMIIPVMPAVNDYAEKVRALFREHKMYADCDTTGATLQKKIRTAQLQQYNFIFVVGAEERKSETVNIRNRDDVKTQAKGELVPLQEALQKLKALRKERRLANAI